MGLRELGHTVDILFTNDPCRNYDSDYDVILVSYATPYPIYDDMEDLLNRNKNARLGWITNEYNLRPNGLFYKFFKERGAFLLSNFDKEAVKFACFDSYHTLNLNYLLFKEYPDIEKTHDFIYWGTFRKDREKYFAEYMQELTYLSTSSKNFKKFKHIGCNPKYIQKINWANPLIRKFRYSLYIEDSFTHDNFNNLANRFYESIGAGCVVLFDKSCINTLERSEIENYEQFIISNKDELYSFKDADFKKLQKVQAEWKTTIKANKKQLIKDIEKVLESETV